MPTDALLATTRRGAELRYLTEHYSDLQGLRLVPLWAGLLAGVGLGASLQVSRWHSVEMFIVIFVLCFGVWYPWSGVWYKRHYGVIANRTAQPSAPGLMWAVFPLFAFFVGTYIFRSLDSYRAGSSMCVILFFLLPKCFYPAPGSMLIRLRRVLYIGGALAIFAIMLGIPFLHPFKFLVLAAISTTLLLLSLYDHWLLNSLLSSKRRSHPLD